MGIPQARILEWVHNLFIWSSVSGHLACFHTLAIVNNAALNVKVYISFQVSVVVFFRLILKNRITGSYDSSIFKFSEEALYFFPVIAPIYRMHKGSIFVHPCQHLLFFLFLIITILIDVLP